MSAAASPRTKFPFNVVTPVTVKFWEKVALPLESNVIAPTAEAEPIVPSSLITISSTKVTTPPEAMVIAEAEEAEPTVPPSATTSLAVVIKPVEGLYVNPVSVSAP